MAFANSSNPFHILHISTAKSWRGGEQQLAYLLEETQTSQKYKPFVLAVPGSPLSQYCEKSGIAWTSLHQGLAGTLYNPFQLKRLVKSLNIDLIQVHDAHGHTLAVKSAVLAGLKKPLIVTRRVDFPVKGNWLSRFKYNQSIVKKIICISEAIQDITKPSIEDPGRLTVVHSGINLERFENCENSNVLRREFQAPEDAWLIGNTSALADHKDYYTFIDTADYLLRQGLNARFFIIGAGPEESHIRQYILQKGLAGFVFMTGFRTDIERLLPELDVYLMTSKTEGLGTSILDALACGIPVVATQAGGIPEMLVHKENGLLSPVKDVHDLGQNVLSLIQKPELRSQLVEAGKQTVRNFSKAHMATGHFQVYEELLG